MHGKFLKLSITVIIFFLFSKGDPNDHHGIMPCAKEKIPEYSHNVQHDSYRAIRSQNVNVHLNIETRRKNSMDRPRLEMFSSTMRWMESLKWLFSGASR